MPMETEVVDVFAVPVSVEAFYDGEEEFVREVLDVAWLGFECVHDLFAG
jgi:hypothetical protein